MRSSARSESPFLASARHSDKVTYIQSWWRTLKVAPGAAQSFCCRGSEGKAGLSDRMWSRAPFKWGHQLTGEPGTLQQENSEQAQSEKKPHCEAAQLTAEFSFFFHFESPKKLLRKLDFLWSQEASCVTPCVSPGAWEVGINARRRMGYPLQCSPIVPSAPLPSQRGHAILRCHSTSVLLSRILNQIIRHRMKVVWKTIKLHPSLLVSDRLGVCVGHTAL